MLLNLSKLSLVLMLLYANFFQWMFFSRNGLTELIGFAAVFLLAIIIYFRSTPLRDGITVEIVLWTAFALTSLFAGYTMVLHQTHLITSVFAFLSNVIMIIAICFICKYDGNIDFIVQAKLFVVFLAAITTVLVGQPFQGGNQISMTASLNPNELGTWLVFGIFALLYKLNVKSKLSMVLVSAGIILFVYTIIVSGSRKSLLGAGLLLVFWLLFVFGSMISKISLAKKAAAITALAVLLGGVAFYMTPFFEDSVMFQRLSSTASGDIEGDENRIGMYNEAIDFFDSSPLFGIGFDEYRMISIYRTYSHSTYAEVLACTGLLGLILYFGAYVTMGSKTIAVIFDKGRDEKTRQQALNILGMFLAMLAVGAGVIHVYGMDSSIIFAAIIGFNKLNYRPLASRLQAGVDQNLPGSGYLNQKAPLVQPVTALAEPTLNENS